jgi:hypothetical protein
MVPEPPPLSLHLKLVLHSQAVPMIGTGEYYCRLILLAPPTQQLYVGPISRTALVLYIEREEKDMKAHVASLMNAVVLIGFGLWGFLSSETPSKTALIPVVFGVVILLLYKGVKKENKIIAHIAVLLTLLILGGLVKPLTAAIGREDGMAIMRVSVMVVSTLVALVFFIKSFIDVRRARASATQG